MIQSSSGLVFSPSCQLNMSVFVNLSMRLKNHLPLSKKPKKGGGVITSLNRALVPDCGDSYL